MPLDFSDQKEQRVFTRGPVPGGSSVMICLTDIIKPTKPEQISSKNQYATVTKNGLIRINCLFTVTQGTYIGYKFYQQISMPEKFQPIKLSEGQRTSCEIGGGMIKAMLEATGRPLVINDLPDLIGLQFPCRLGIAREPTKKNGKIYWHNEISVVLTPAVSYLKDDYNTVKTSGEILVTDGPIAGKLDTYQNQGDQPTDMYFYDNTQDSGAAQQATNQFDNVPF